VLIAESAQTREALETAVTARSRSRPPTSPRPPGSPAGAGCCRSREGLAKLAGRWGAA